MKEGTTMNKALEPKERDISPQELKKAIDNLSLADKLFINAIMQMGLAFEAAKAMGKQS